MKILVVGASGLIGRAVVKELQEFEVIEASRNSGIKVDILSQESIENMYKSVGKFDALIATVGGVVFKPLQELTEVDFLKSLQDKFMGQINLVLIGRKYINKGGSFTLTSGVLAHEFIKSGVCATVINRSINGFVQASACEFIQDNIRINVVSPTVLEEAYDNYYPYFSGFTPVSSKKVAFAFRKSVTGIQSGQVFIVE